MEWKGKLKYDTCMEQFQQHTIPVTKKTPKIGNKRLLKSKKNPKNSKTNGFFKNKPQKWPGFDCNTL